MGTYAPSLHIQPPSTPTDNKNNGQDLKSIPSPRLTPRDYATRIFEHSQTTARNSLYQGQCYARLAELLQSPFQNYKPVPQATSNPFSAEESSRPDDGGFVWFYSLNGRTPKLEAATSIPDLARDSNTSSKGTLIFLRGYPSWKLLTELGSKFKVDPEFYHRHLDFLPIGKESGFVWNLRLPSRQRYIFHTTITSVGRQDNSKGLDPVAKRSSARIEMQKYLQSLKKADGWNAGDSIVRAFSVHDKEEFNIDQAITIYVSKLESADDSEQWIALVWLDSAKDLSSSPFGPWLRSSRDAIMTSFYPVNLHKPGVALRCHQIPEDQQSPALSKTRLFQSLSLLPRLYGQSLWPTVMQDDAFYTLHELFGFIASSELRFLKAIASKLEVCISARLNGDAENPLLAQKNIDHYHYVLGTHYARTQETLNFINSRDTLEWPRCSNEIANVAAARLERDFHYLLNQTKLLQERCSSEMIMRMNGAALAETRRSLEQGQRATKLTVLATVFVPLAFTSSIFGMNFVTFPDNTQGLWVWSIVSLPTFLLALLVISWDKERILSLIRSAQQAVWR